MSRKPITVTPLPIADIQLLRLLRVCLYDLLVRAPELMDNLQFQNDMAALECAYVNISIKKGNDSK